MNNEPSDEALDESARLSGYENFTEVLQRRTSHTARAICAHARTLDERRLLVEALEFYSMPPSGQFRGNRAYQTLSQLRSER